MDEMLQTVAAVQAVINANAGQPAFKMTIALLKAAIVADKDPSSKSVAMLMYMRAAEFIAEVRNDPEAKAAVKAGLEKKLTQVDGRIAMGLKSTRELFSDLDEDGSGTLEEPEVELLMGKMGRTLDPGEFAQIDTDGSGSSFPAFC